MKQCFERIQFIKKTSMIYVAKALNIAHTCDIHIILYLLLRYCGLFDFKCDWTYHQSPHPEERDGILMSLRKSLIHVLWLSQNTNWGIQLVLIVKCELQNVNLLKFETSNLKICIYLIIVIMGINGFERYLVSKVSTLESCVSLERTRVNIKYWRLHAMWSKLNSNLYQFSGKRIQKFFQWLYKYVSKRKPSSVKLCYSSVKLHSQMSSCIPSVTLRLPSAEIHFQ